MTDFITNTFKNALLSGQKLIGGWSLSGDATVAEAMASMPYDYLVLDLEHSPAGVQDLPALLRATDGMGMATVIRMAGHCPIDIKKAMDSGAMNFLFPYVQSVQQCNALVSACKYPPMGTRGFAFMTRGSRYTSQGDYPARANNETFVGIQLETPHALSIAVDIGTLPGVDSVFIGPADLSVNMGHPGDITHREVRGAMERCVQTLNNHNIPVGTIAPTEDYAQWALQTGFNYVSISNDLALIVKGGAEKCDTVRTVMNIPPADIRRC